MKYHAIFEFLNVYSETFVTGGGSSQDSAATKEWLNQVVPEMTDGSSNDICLGKSKTLCVIYVTSGEVLEEHIDALK